MLDLAEFWSQHSSCLRRQVGAVLYDPKTKAIISVSYNDTAMNATNCGDGGCDLCQEPEDVKVKTALDCHCIHAEMNALLLAGRHGRKTEGAVIAVTHIPCASCHKHLTQAGVTHVFGKLFGVKPLITEGEDFMESSA